MAERVGFEPTVPFDITGFQDQLLKPLGHLSTISKIIFLFERFVKVEIFFISLQLPESGTHLPRLVRALGEALLCRIRSGLLPVQSLIPGELPGFVHWKGLGKVVSLGAFAADGFQEFKVLLRLYSFLQRRNPHIQRQLHHVANQPAGTGLFVIGPKELQIQFQHIELIVHQMI